MADLFENPMGLMGFEFIEFASPTPNVIEPVLESMGFSHVANHRSKDVALYRQGEINHCPGCGRSHWLIGRLSAECGFCATALPLADTGLVGAGTHSRGRRTEWIQADAA